jgi:CIC family chloride channel protein
VVSLGDFTTNRRQLGRLSLVALFLGLAGGIVAFLLLRLIGLITHLTYDGVLNASLAPPSIARLGWWSVLIPVAGGLAVGLLARFFTQQIRGHGIPEAIQAILENESRMDARVAIAKPVASAITIGTGGPFGAEGPIIMTGGAIGSLTAQWLPLSAVERRVLLVAGAAAGMSATFGAPLSSVFLAVELLLFEWRPRSVLPVMVASVAAYGMRVWLLGSAAIFATRPLPWTSFGWLFWAAAVGIAAGTASGLLTKAVYLVEDLYHRLPLHWMWWPAIGGLFVGLGGMVDPAALGVGYPAIRGLDAGNILLTAAALLLGVKAVIWILSLSSGTSGGVLAPLLMMGGAIGALLGGVLPGHDPGLWATVGMAAMLGGTMRAPFTATVFAMETTHDWGIVLPVFVGSMVAMAVTVVWIPRSILTEKVARRGTHVAREYGVHPLEGSRVSSLMVPKEAVITVSPDLPLREAAARLLGDPKRHHGAYPVIDATGTVVGVLSRLALLSSVPGDDTPVSRVMVPPVPVAPSARARHAVELMARHDIRWLLVEDGGVFVGWMTQVDLLPAWRRAVREEEVRARIFTLPFSSRGARVSSSVAGSKPEGPSAV